MHPKKRSPVRDPQPATPAFAKILNIDPNSILAYQEHPDGTVVVVTGCGQKFTFTAGQLANPDSTRAQINSSVKVFGQLPPDPPPPLAIAQNESSEDAPPSTL